MNYPTTASLPQVGHTESETELGSQLNQLFGEIARTGELASILSNRLHLITKLPVPSPGKPEPEQIMPPLSPLADALRTKGMELMEANNSINDLINRLAI